MQRKKVELYGFPRVFPAMAEQQVLTAGLEGDATCQSELSS
jgi:hypothetical protein